MHMHTHCRTASRASSALLANQLTNSITYQLTGAAALVLKPGIIGGAPPGKFDP